MQSVHIQGFSYTERRDLLPVLLSAIADCGGWVLGRRSLSTSSIEFRLEIQMCSILDLYASIISSGLELTRSGHIAMSNLCTCLTYHDAALESGRILSICMEVSFLDDLTLQ